jgi:hypothetical protein
MYSISNLFKTCPFLAKLLTNNKKKRRLRLKTHRRFYEKPNKLNGHNCE